MESGQTYEGLPVEMTQEEYSAQWEILKNPSAIEFAWVTTEHGKLSINAKKVEAVEMIEFDDSDATLEGAL